MPDVDEFRAKLRLYELLERLDIGGRIRDEMIREPARALRVLEAAVRARGVRNRAALAVSRWKASELPAFVCNVDESAGLADAPPTLAALEHAWSKSENVQAIVLPLIARGIERHGGFGRLK